MPRLEEASNELWRTWVAEDDVPQSILSNAAFAIRSMDETGVPTPLTREEVRGILVCMRHVSARVGTYLDGE